MTSPGAPSTAVSVTRPNPATPATALTLATCLSLAAAASAGEPRLCESLFLDRATGRPTTLSVLVTRPTPDAQLRAFAPDCPATVEGVASAVGIPARFDFYVVLDLSGSTNSSSGVDIDGDGRVSEERPSGDSIFEAELLAARRFVDVLDFAHHRVSLIGFSTSARLLHPLSEDRESLRAALANLSPPSLTAQTSFGRPLERVLDEHAAASDPTREQVVLFLSDGAPNVVSPPPADAVTCRRRPSECVGIQWAAVAAERGLVVNTFAVGAQASTTVLNEMAAAGGGRMERLDVAGEIIHALPRASHVGIAEVRVENRSTGRSLIVQPGPDGAFLAPMEFRAGGNEIVVSVTAEHEDSWTLSCSSTVDVHCLEVGCPDDLHRECEGGGAHVEDFAAWASDPLVRIRHALPAKGETEGADASGRFPLGNTLVTWTFEDDEAGMASCNSVVNVSDTLAPRLARPDPIVEGSCRERPPTPAVLVEDDCDDEPVLEFTERRVEGDCPDSFELHRSWTATDASGLQASVSQLVLVSDQAPPSLVGAPESMTVSCLAVPAPASVQAKDDCDPSPRLDFAEARSDGPCPGSYQLERSWLAIDRCGNVASHVQRVTVVDDEPPLIVPRQDNAVCLRGRNHELLRIDANRYAPTVIDGCSGGATWQVVACLSDQPDDALGDGSTSADCRVDEDGRSLLVRAERQGRGSEPHRGRTYTVLAVAEDPCGNVSAPTRIAFIHVRHDQSGHDETCR